MFKRARNAVYFLGPITVVCFLLGSVFLSYIKAFDSATFKVEGAYAHIAELTSAEYAGRLAGSDGNKLAMEYIENRFKQIGLAPAGDNDTYYQRFKTMVPSYDTQAMFRVLDSGGNTVKEFAYGIEYMENLTGLGGRGTGTGELFVAGADLKTYPKELIKGKVVLLKQVPQERDTQYALDNGVKGIIARGSLKKYPVDLGFKPAQTLPILTVEPGLYDNLISMAGAGLEAEIKVDIAVNFVETANVLGKIPGKGPGYIFISADLDYLGRDSFGGYFPGAFDGASGVGVMLELAKALQEQKITPDRTIVFAAWNNQQFGAKGAMYYVQHPLFPLKKSQVLMLQNLGGTEELNLKSFDKIGTLLSKVIGGYAQDLNLAVQQKNDTIGHLAPFGMENVPSVMISDSYSGSQALNSVIYTHNDDLTKLSKQSLRQTSTVLVNYLRREIYRDSFPDYIGKAGMTVLGVFGIGLLLIYLVFTLQKLLPGLRLGKICVADIYYSTFFQLFTKGYFYLTTALLLFIVVAFVANVPQDFNIVYTNGEVYNNFSLFLVTKKTFVYISRLLTTGLSSTQTGANALNLIGGAFGRSCLLLLLVMLVSSIFGTLKGLRDGLKGRSKQDMGAVTALAVLSVPDVLIVVILQLAVIFLYNHQLLPFLNNRQELTSFSLAFICLVILPTVYISRLAANAVQEELDKDYVMAARAKGLPQRYLLKVHLMPSVAIRVLNALPLVLGQVVSNLIVIEYLLLYPGIVSALLKSYEQNDTLSFIGLAMSLALVYILFTLCFRSIARLINPTRKGRVL